MAGRSFDKIREQEGDRAWLSQIVCQLQSSNWYGNVTIKMENGNIKRVIKEESVVPPSVANKDKAEVTS